MKRSERLSRLTATARERCVEGRAERERQAGAAAHTGGVFRLDETADLGVMWVLVEHDRDRRRFVALAADLNPLVGSADVAVPPDSSCGSLSLRCAVEVEIAEPWLEAATWAGTLEPGFVEQVRRRRAEVQSGRVAAPLSAQDTDADPEYRDWLEDGPRKAQALLLRRQVEKAGRVLGFRDRRRGRFFGVPANLAASVLLLVSMGLVAGLVWKGREPRRAEALVRLPFAILGTGQVRDEIETVEVPAGVASFLLLVETNASYPAYRLEIRDEVSDALVWGDALEPTRERRGRFEPILLPVVLPRRTVASGDYRVRLFGLQSGQAQALEERLLRVRMK